MNAPIDFLKENANRYRKLIVRRLLTEQVLLLAFPNNQSAPLQLIKLATKNQFACQTIEQTGTPGSIQVFFRLE